MDQLSQVQIESKYYSGLACVMSAKYGDGSTALILNSPDGERIAVATVCLDTPAKAGHVWLKGWSENLGIPKALHDAGVVRLTGKTRATGYVYAVEAELL